MSITHQSSFCHLSAQLVRVWMVTSPVTLFHAFILGSRWSFARSCGYELVTKDQVWMHFSNYFSYHLLTRMYVPIRVIRVPRSASASALSGPHGPSDEFFAVTYLTRSTISFRTVLQPSNRYLHIFNCRLEIIEKSKQLMKHRPTCFSIAYYSSVRYVSEPSRKKTICCPSTVCKYLFKAWIRPFDMDWPTSFVAFFLNTLLAWSHMSSLCKWSRLYNFKIKH
jgi:hypothetical protein